jgi:hypothetical protein
MVHCKSQNAAMQTNGLLLVSGIPRLDLEKRRSDPAVPQQGNKMSKSASIRLAPSATLFGRLMVTVDRLLMAHAAIAIRNGDLPYFGL